MDLVFAVDGLKLLCNLQSTPHTTRERSCKGTVRLLLHVIANTSATTSNTAMGFTSYVPSGDESSTMMIS